MDFLVGGWGMDYWVRYYRRWATWCGISGAGPLGMELQGGRLGLLGVGLQGDGLLAVDYMWWTTWWGTTE